MDINITNLSKAELTAVLRACNIIENRGADTYLTDKQINMKSIFATLAVALLINDVQAHKMRSVGIFDKLYKEEAEAQALVDQKQEAIAYKKKQLIEAEKEHEQAVKEED